jgi:oligopeptide/dipeptide ABC transporter ATP-binding protein
VPEPAVGLKRVKNVLNGDIPVTVSEPGGCSFHSRCPEVMDVCKKIFPSIYKEGEHTVYCHLKLK